MWVFSLHFRYASQKRAKQSIAQKQHSEKTALSSIHGDLKPCIPYPDIHGLRGHPELFKNRALQEQSSLRTSVPRMRRLSREIKAPAINLHIPHVADLRPAPPFLNPIDIHHVAIAIRPITFIIQILEDILAVEVRLHQLNQHLLAQLVPDDPRHGLDGAHLDPRLAIVH